MSLSIIHVAHANTPAELIIELREYLEHRITQHRDELNHASRPAQTYASRMRGRINELSTLIQFLDDLRIEPKSSDHSSQEASAEA